MLISRQLTGISREMIQKGLRLPDRLTFRVAFFSCMSADNLKSQWDVHRNP